MKTKCDEEYLYDVQCSDLLEDEYPDLIYILVLHKTRSITATNLLLIVVNILMEVIHLTKGEILGHLEPTDLIHNDLTTETVYEAVFQDKDLIDGVESDSASQNKGSTQKVCYFFSRHLSALQSRFEKCHNR